MQDAWSAWPSDAHRTRLRYRRALVGFLWPNRHSVSNFVHNILVEILTLQLQSAYVLIFNVNVMGRLTSETCGWRKIYEASHRGAVSQRNDWSMCGVSVVSGLDSKLCIKPQKPRAFPYSVPLAVA